MLDGRYRDRKYLSKYDLSIDLFDRFELKVSDVFPIRNVFVLSTDKGDKVLKRIDYSLEDLEFVNTAITYISNHFDRVLQLIETKDKKVYTEWKNDIYCIMDLVPGRECDFDNPIDLCIASKGLSQLHKASLGFKPDNPKKYTAGKSIESYNRRIKEMGIFRSIANMHEYKSEFDKIFLKNIDTHLEDMKRSVKILEDSEILELCKEKDKVVICHNDLAYHNILINNDEAYFIDFDFAIVDLKVHDLCNFINKAIKNTAFDIDKAKAILSDYCKNNPLDERELKVLYGMLTFPEDFYSISRDYYTRRKDWEEEVFLDRLIKKVSFKEDREEFLESFEKNILW
ncbi:CotS family spore coat protein [Clostridium sp. YIM B02515]|uniref:CotS family spore coat protein n=1 Tax=Clostridium rhizosphaerae TaxID=2803861 RepID=A0ABS1T947_9CLOT|nr:CotS family spore coat protein [Clostridium rhizosphaerae]MBL4935852.1 CotS family spore coat protein [Clostridium rhizosphaerae]